MTALRIPHRNSRIGKFMHLVRKLNCQNDTGFQSLSLLIPRMINLTTINFSNNTNINDDCIRLIASYCPNLESLNVSKCYCLTHKALYYIAKQFRYLKSLNISSTGCVNDKSWIVLCVLNDTLKHLNMASCYNLNWYNVHKIYPSSLATWDISNNCRLNFDYLAGIANIRSKSDITDTLLITCKNCESLTLGELSQLEGISDAKMKFISNSLLKDYSSEGVREYIKLLLGV
ncbi:hypothetical protein HK103_005206 [Boothiomyces macroporosus]|uniref:Uncharacterized protein n=1 Tax=Boothiomyces macroporosus TaxID=261099 RepID=A0AAD5Y2W4_9FUNG|nr:hypothetical protein HK103_005206 [Boothiomyces macroporosus]